MKLQIAIDRKSLAETQELVRVLDGVADIIEFGTSLVKDFGLEGIEPIASTVHRSRILYDIKTVDEGAYEFQSGFAHGADYLTIMGSSAYPTVSTCYRLTDAEHNIMIDLTDTDDTKLDWIEEFPRAIYLVHHNNDLGTVIQPDTMLTNFAEHHAGQHRLAVAGGITLPMLENIKRTKLAEIVVVGGAITKSDNPQGQAQQFRQALDQ